METRKKEFIDVSIHMKIDGELINLKNVRYERSSETSTFSLDQLARIIFMWEKMIAKSSTYAMEGYLQKAESKLEKRDGETAQSVFEKYWVNTKETIEQEFMELNKGGKVMYPETNDFLTHQIYMLCYDFENSAIPAKYGFVHWLHKYVMNGNLSEFEHDVNATPDYIREIVDNKIGKQP